MRGAHRLLLALFLLCTLGNRLLAEEQAVIHIRARSQLHLREGGREHAKDGYRLTVLVQLDDSRSAASAAASAAASVASPAGEDAAHSFSGQHIRLELIDAEDTRVSTTAVTDADGTASRRFVGLPAGRYRLVATYSGDEERDGVEATLDVDLDRRPVELLLDVPATIGVHDALPVTVALRTSGGASAPLVAPARVELALKSGPELLRWKTCLLSMKEASELFRLPRPLPAGAVLTVEARFSGDEENAPALFRREVQLTTQAKVTLEVAAPRGAGGSSKDTLEVPQGSRLVLTGLISDEDGPLPAEVVELEAASGGERRRLGSALSDEKGRYELALDKLGLRVGAAFLSAQVSSRHRYVLVGRSAELPITVLPPEPISVLYFLLPLCASAGATLLLFLGRALAARLALALFRWRQRRRAVKKGRRSPEAILASSSPPPSASPGEAGVTLGSRSQLGSLILRRTVDTTIEGAVHDAVFGPAIGGATLQLVPSASASLPGELTKSLEAHTTETGSDGRFIFSQVPPGRYVVRIRAPGYLPEEFSAGVPHRGELRGIAVRMMPVRARLLDEWQRVALFFYGDETQLLTRTPQELLRFAEERRKSPPLPHGLDLPRLRRLTQLVEEGYYSQKLCTEAMLDEALQLATALIRPDLHGGRTEPPLPKDASRDIRAPGAPRPLV